MIGPGSVVAQAYRVERKVGRGAMGTVFEATVIATGERVALKIPHECFLADRSALKRFMREATATLTIRSPFVIRTMAVGKLPTGMPFLAMEFVDGPSLAELMDRFAGAPMPLPLAMRLLLQLAEGLSTAHEAGVIHRDLKPGNVLVASPGGGAVARIFDFGLSVLAFDEAGRLTLSGTTFGTPQYMAPEQIRAAKHAGVQSDVYALGVMAYEMLAARWPFSGPTALDIWHSATHFDAIPLSKHRPDLPAGLCGVVMRAMARETGARFESAEDLRCALAPFAGGD